MFSLFSTPYAHRTNISRHPSTDWIAKRFDENIAKQQEYAIKSAHAVYANHPLVQALKLIGANADKDIVDLYNYVWIRAPYVATILKFSSPTNPGTFTAHQIYASTDSMVFSEATYISPTKGLANWRNLSPVKVMWIDADQVQTEIPSRDGKPYPFTAVVVDLPMLVLMYRGFINYRKEVMATLPEYGVYGEEHFIAMHVLPNMIRSQVNLSAISATIALYNGEYERTSRVDSPNYLPSYANDFEKIAKYSLKQLVDVKQEYRAAINQLPAFYGQTALDVLQLPDTLVTTQGEWALFASRLRVMMFIIDVGGKQGRDANKAFIGQLQKKSKELKITGIPRSKMSDEMYDYISETISYIQTL